MCVWLVVAGRSVSVASEEPREYVRAIVGGCEQKIHGRNCPNALSQRGASRNPGSSGIECASR
jgi:hypothetical protein